MNTERRLGVKNIGAKVFCKSHGFHVKIPNRKREKTRKAAKENYAKGQPSRGMQFKDSDLMFAIEEPLSLTLRSFSETGQEPS